MASSAPDRLTYEVVDVFAPRPFSGNQLAVVLDAGDLTTAQCQTLAAEFGYSESTFVSAPGDPGPGGGPTADYRVRIFTPETELPFAGHPSVGTAHTLVRLGRAPEGVLRQQCGVGVVDVEVDRDGARLTGGPVSLRPGPDPAALAAALGLTAADATGRPASLVGCGIDFAQLEVRRDALDGAVPDPAELAEAVGLGAGEVTGRPAHLVGCGIDFAQLEVHPGALERAEPDRVALRRLLPGVQGGISLLAWDAASATGTVRVFAGGLGWEEDPATGSAALGTGVWLAATGLVPDGETAFTLHQGAVIARPSVLRCTVTAEGGRAVTATAAGAVVPVARGVIRLPAR